jgi:hypothetical protein
LNFIWLLRSPNLAIMPVNAPVHMKSHLICETNLA